MADNFDAIQIIHDMISYIGVTLFQDRAPKDQAGEYIVVRSTECVSREVVNLPSVNVNIYVPRARNSQPNRIRLEAIRTLVYAAMAAATDPAGYYCVIEQAFSALVEDARDGYDCFTIRYELTLR